LETSWHYLFLAIKSNKKFSCQQKIKVVTNGHKMFQLPFEKAWLLDGDQKPLWLLTTKFWMGECYIFWKNSWCELFLMTQGNWKFNRRQQKNCNNWQLKQVLIAKLWTIEHFWLSYLWWPKIGFGRQLKRLDYWMVIETLFQSP